MAESSSSEPEETNSDVILGRYKDMTAQCQNIVTKMHELTLEVSRPVELIIHVYIMLNMNLYIVLVNN